MSGSKRTVWAGAAALLVAVIAAAGWFYAQQAGPGKDSGGLARYAVGEMAALAIPEGLEAASDHVFLGPDGTQARLADFHGQVVVVNLWATWCAPCLAEMPTLAALARAHGDRDDLLVLPISVDVAAQRDKAQAFIAGHPPLPFYNDPTFQLPFEFGAKGGMPQTILLDRQGRVRGALTGGADWSGPEARALIDALLAEGA
jgi:thiol-disulfide isomerase/thioredoxin